MLNGLMINTVFVHEGTDLGFSYIVVNPGLLDPVVVWMDKVIITFFVARQALSFPPCRPLRVLAIIKLLLFGGWHRAERTHFETYIPHTYTYTHKSISGSSKSFTYLKSVHQTPLPFSSPHPIYPKPAQHHSNTPSQKP